MLFFLQLRISQNTWTNIGTFLHQIDSFKNAASLYWEPKQVPAIDYDREKC